MKFISAASTDIDFEDALKDLVQQTLAQTGDAALDLVVVFISAQFMYAVGEIVKDLHAALQPGLLVGCTAEGVISRDREIENEPAIALVAATLPGSKLHAFILQPASLDWPSLLLDEQKFMQAISAPENTHLLMLLSDPFSTPMEDLLEAFNHFYPGIPVVGGMASAALRPNGNLLFVNDQIVQEGAVGVAFAGEMSVDIIVSQGCRPIWRPFKVVQAYRNQIINLEGRAPLAWMQDLIPGLSEEDKVLLQNGMYVGLAVKPEQEALGRGDFLIRGVVGIDQENGAIAIGDSIMDGEIIQFHLRDAVTAQEDLEMQLITQIFREKAMGGLLFNCNGRGTRLYDRPNLDIYLIQQNIRNAPLAGFFCAGEIGPIAGVNYLHGQTAVVVLFRPTVSSH
jgi:small ligand-binding sensory domain FIST